MSVLVTGNKSGLGRFLFEEIEGSIGFNRKSSFQDISKSKYDCIIHCAFNTSRDIPSSELYSYYKDTIELIEKLISLNHKKFIFISSIDVYPKEQDKIWNAEDEIIIDRIDSIYGKTKLLCEEIVKHKCKNHLIIRPSSLVGKYMRKNSYLKIIEDENPKLSLSADSIFNYIKYEDLLSFIKSSIKDDITGIRNFISKENVTLAKLAKMSNKTPNFGEYIYITPSIKQ